MTDDTSPAQLVVEGDNRPAWRWLSCPHCGSKPQGLIRVDTEPGDWSVAVVCAHCGARGGEGDTEGEATELWNLRGSP